MSRSGRDNIIKGQEELTGFLGAKVTFMCGTTNSNGTCCSHNCFSPCCTEVLLSKPFQCNLKWSHPSDVKPLITNKSG